MPTSTVPAIILAAGFSRRLGRPKQTLLVEGEMLVTRAARVASEAGLFPVFVVVGERAGFCDLLEANGCRCVLNTDAAEGIASSIRAGVRAAADATAVGAVVMACDQPTLSAQHLAALVVEPTRTTASVYAGRRGIPAYFAAVDFPALLALRGDVGARSLLEGAHSVVDETLAFDVDTEADALLLDQVQGVDLRRVT